MRLQPYSVVIAGGNPLLVVVPAPTFFATIIGTHWQCPPLSLLVLNLLVLVVDVATMVCGYGGYCCKQTFTIGTMEFK